MRFDKINVSESQVLLEWVKQVENNGTIISEKLESDQRPAPELLHAMIAFRPYVCELLGLPDEMKEVMEIRTVHLKEDEKTHLRTLQVTIVVRAEKAGNKAWTTTTPLMRDRGGDEGGHFLERDTMKRIQRVEKAAEGFFNGERDQMELIPPNAAEATQKEPEKPKPGRRPRSDYSRDGHQVVNPDAKIPITDELLQKRLAEVERAVPIDAIARWTSTERNEAVTWATDFAVLMGQQGQTTDLPPEPLCVKRDATPPLGGEPWTAPQLPPKAPDVRPVTP